MLIFAIYTYKSLSNLCTRTENKYTKIVKYFTESLPKVLATNKKERKKESEEMELGKLKLTLFFV